MRRLLHLVVSLVVLCGLVFGTVTLVRLANGDFAGDYKLSGTFPRAGEGLNPGSAVVFRGVQVGRVSTITLEQNQAKVTLLIEPSFQVPTTATATIEPVNLFGAEQVAISTPHGNSAAGPYLEAGSSFAHAASSDELGDLFAAATPLLNEIDTTKLSSVLGELAQASQGEGPKIAASISAGTQLAGLLDRTVNAQILALQSFAKIHPGHRPRGGRPQQPRRADQCRTAVLQRRRGRLRESPQHPDPVLEPLGRAALDLPPRHRDHPRIGRQRVPCPPGPAGHDRAGHQRGVPLLPEDRPGRIRPEQTPRRKHLCLLQHVHPLQRREQPGVQSHCAADGRDVVPRADTAGAGRSRVRLQLLLGALDVRLAPGKFGDPGGRRRLRRRPPLPRPAPTALRPRQPTRPTV